MKPEDVGGDLMAAFSDGWATNGVRGGIAAVAPLIAAAEREACAKVVDAKCVERRADIDRAIAAKDAITERAARCEAITLVFLASAIRNRTGDK